MGDHEVFFLKPQTFMNLSGKTLGEIANFYKITPEHIIVFHDDLDLVPGKVRVKQGGGAGGHNGLKHIDAHFGKNYWRVRIGIGHPGDKKKVTSYVLGNFDKDELEWVIILLQILAKELPTLIQGRGDQYINTIAHQVGPWLKTK